MTPTPLDGAGLVAHGGATVEKLKRTSNSQLDKNTNPCPIKATNHSILNVNLNLINTDANSDLFQKSLIAKNKNSDLNNDIISDNVLSPAQKSYSKM